MRLLLIILVIFKYSNLMGSEFKEDLIFQKNYISQNNIISEISNKEELLKLIDMTELNDNFFYALFDPLTNNNIYPLYSNEFKFFFEKIHLFHSKPYGYQINSNIFENVLFEKFDNPDSNHSYLDYLFGSSQIQNMCSYLSALNESQKKFNKSIQYNLVCLLNKKQFSQISLLLEIYDQKEILELNTKFLLKYLANEEINDEYNLSELGIIDKYILTKLDSKNLNIDNISNLLELEIYLKTNSLKSYQINNLFKKRIINVQQYLSLVELLPIEPLELKMYKEISREINYNKKLSILENYISNISLDVYDLSRLVNDQFKEMRITSTNLEYIDGLMLLSLYENSSFLENLVKVLTNVPDTNIENTIIAKALKNYLTQNNKSDIYVEGRSFLESPLMKFLFLNENIKFLEVQMPNFGNQEIITVSPNYLFYLAENFNLLESYAYYLSLSEKYYSINEYDLYFLNKYLIENEYLKNELIKLIFKVHLSNI